MSLTSEEVNFLIYRYLLESGFLHSAFLFGHESTVLRSDIDGSAVPPGALISFIQKGLQYTEIESHVSEDGTELQCGEPFSVLHPHVCRSNNKKRIFDPSGEVLDEDYGNLEAAYDQIIQLKGHVVACTRVAWNASKDTVAAGAFDGSVRIWEIVGRENRAGSTAKIRAIPEPTRVLMAPLPIEDEKEKHEKSESKLPNGASKADQKHSVTDLEWNSSGSFLAAGFMDGRVFVWTAAGEPKILPQSKHAAPVIAVRWAVGADSRLLSASLDGAVFVWDLDTLERKACFTVGKAPILDASWRNDTSFVTCCSDGSVVLSTLDSADVRRFAGHENDANKVTFDVSRSLFATASDDVTVKVWSVDNEKPIHTFCDHSREVIALAWSPVNNPSLAKPESGEKKPRVLASSSYDCTIVIYDVDAGSKLLTINRPTHPVTVLKFSPNGEYLASVSNDRLFVWNVKDGSLARTFKATDGISDCSWDGNSSRVSTVASDGTCAVVAMK